MSTSRRTRPSCTPLEPLTRRGGRRGVGDPEGREGPRSHGAVRLHLPARAAQGAPCRRARPSPREAFVVLYEKAERKTYEAVVSLDRRRASSPSTHIEGVQPPITVEEFMACEEVVQADPRLAGRRCASAGSRTSRWR